ncbi:hypothetical protein B0T26DRAFT_196098 [Lasiosphaeria miniovina]|uniref:Uncharacterized protein n=1 Tax=Lasiosphaeria miniovina TaxID=1954250 RepID=A0AA40DZY3_9PEZI|nr:uncharacterized protein B0T26DRAFT_196098 [Lasiosphaeria miniovina]KAK0721925.1 hypothetical protein B0T26DRAFT_196098 [Lasiosphaeria miniovina]
MIKKRVRRPGQRPTSGLPAQPTRRFANDVESQRERDKENEESIRQRPLSDRRSISKKTELSRYNSWIECTSSAQFDPKEVILDLCRDPASKERAVLQVKKFLQYCVQKSEAERPSLGPTETEFSLTITSARTVFEKLKSVVGYAESHILHV